MSALSGSPQLSFPGSKRSCSVIFVHFICRTIAALLLLLPCSASCAVSFRVPILLYHRLGPTVADGMTITTRVFESQMKYLRDNGFTVIPLRRLIDRYRGRDGDLPRKAVVIVADDAHSSVYGEMLPIVRLYRYPVTIFAYPSAISNAKYAMTWGQLRELKRSGLFDVQSHSYWHPNFISERKKRKPADFDRFVMFQLRKSKLWLESELGGTVDLLAWPFGLYDDNLIRKGAEAGYVAAFTIEPRHCTEGDDMMKLPRYLLKNADSGRAFARLLEGNVVERRGAYR
jgi:peptidoglycan/xylan/chitin deacetylase (PgdA/CDA1 family)